VSGVYQFLKSTVIGGLLVLVPLVVLGVIIVRTGMLVYDQILPLLRMLPLESARATTLAVLLAILSLVAACFLAGLAAQTRLIRRLIDRTEQQILSHIPGYELMKNVGENLAGIEGQDARKTVLARIADSYQLGFLMDTLADGRHLVFIPGVPRVLVGALHILSPGQVQMLAMPVNQTLEALGRLGVGLRESWPAENNLNLMERTQA
jgi:uncharacterized membrane protein